MRIDGSTRIVGVFGYPIKHTASPPMHNAAFRALNLNWVYLPFEVRPDMLESAVKAIGALNIQGMNVTIPHKRGVLQFMDGLSPEAEFIGAVNTIINKNGKLVGHNTDGEGFIRALKEENILPTEKNILILGAGGASYGISRQLFLEGAKKIEIANRTFKKAEDLKRQLIQYFPSGNVEIFPLEAPYLESAMRRVDILINATSVGMKPDEHPIVREEWLDSPFDAVVDLIYNPPLTPLLKIAKEKGLKVINGLSMLLHQGALSFKLWTGREAPLEVMREELYNQFKM